MAHPPAEYDIGAIALHSVVPAAPRLTQTLARTGLAERLGNQFGLPP